MFHRVVLGVAVVLTWAGSSAWAQDYFPAQIQRGSLTVGIQDFARLPNSAGAPARASLMTRDPLGRLFVNDQRGPLYTLNNSGGGVTEYLDLQDYAANPVVTGSGEAGFQSFAFHPDFNVAGSDGFGKFYTLHSTTNTSPAADFNPGGSRVFDEVLLEWSAATPGASTFAPANAAQPFREVMRFSEPFTNHNGGLISFNTSAGPLSADRNNLYLALGDGGSGNDPQENGQNTANPYGKVLRINPTGSNSANGKYGLVASNVFASDGNAGTLAEVY